MTVISAILALLKALPILDSWFKQLAVAYMQMKIASHDKDFVEANRALIQDHDQRALEAAAGSSNAGAPALDQTGVHTRPGAV